MKRYAVFGYEQYYPSGGWNDLVGRYDTVEEAREGKVDAEAKA